jgi:YegS/Rv2252/BmrU family lipid kinase
MAVNLAIVWNPATVRDPDGLRAELKRRAADSDVCWFETMEADPGAGQTEQALADGAELVLVCGGDGTVAACAGTLAGTGVPMGLVPTGTGNLLARNLGLPLELAAALDRVFGGKHRTIDLVETADKRFAVMAGLGFDAALIRDTGERAKQRHGWIAYVAGGLRALRNTPRACYDVRVDNGPGRQVRALGVLVGNVGKLQGGMRLLPDADPSDGLLDVIVLAPQTWRDIAVLAWRIVRGRPDAGRQADIVRGQYVEIRVDRPVPLQFDGDYAGEQECLSVAVLPGAVSVCGAD